MTSCSKTSMLALCLTLLAAGCGGGGGGGGIDGTGGTGSNPIAPGAEAPAPGTAPNTAPGLAPSVSFGAITAFGSVWVNGVEFNTSQAAFQIGGVAATQNDLKVGMIVRVDGSIADKTASRVIVDEPIRGRVEQVIDANQIVLMGQPVEIEPESKIEGGVMPKVGDYVDAYVFTQPDGYVAVTYLLKKEQPVPAIFSVKGVVKEHDPVSQSFEIGSLKIGYGTISVAGMPSGLWNGQLVNVAGANCQSVPVCGRLTASKVALAVLGVDSSALAQVEGYINTVGVSGFVINGQAVVTNAKTVFDGGLPEDIIPWAKVEISGAITGGVLTASKILFRDNIRLEADIASANASARVFTLSGLPGVTVNINSLTQFKGGAALNKLPVAPNHVRIRGRAAAGGAVTVTELQLRSAGGETTTVLQGPLQSVRAPVGFSILGVNVDTSGVADAGFTALSGALLGRTAFFNRLQFGTQVKAKGKRNGTAVLWNEMELED
jgi:Domain of unknown function (DUF5666)